MGAAWPPRPESGRGGPSEVVLTSASHLARQALEFAQEKDKGRRRRVAPAARELWERVSLHGPDPGCRRAGKPTRCPQSICPSVCLWTWAPPPGRRAHARSCAERPPEHQRLPLAPTPLTAARAEGQPRGSCRKDLSQGRWGACRAVSWLGRGEGISWPQSVFVGCLPAVLDGDPEHPFRVALGGWGTVHMLQGEEERKATGQSVRGWGAGGGRSGGGGQCTRLL